MSYETFEAYLFSELTSRKLYYVFDVIESSKVNKEILEHDQNTVQNLAIDSKQQSGCTETTASQENIQMMTSAKLFFFILWRK